MGRHRFAVVVCCTLLAGGVASLSADTIRVYQAQDLGFLPGSNYLVGNAMNVNGEVAGMAVGPDGLLHAIRWTPTGGIEDLSQAGVPGYATAINDRGDVVGKSYPNSGNGAFIAPRGGGLIDLSPIYPKIETIRGISNDGRLTGNTWEWHAFRTQPDGTFQELTTNFSFAAGINDNGEVAGVVWRDGSMTEPRHAFRFSEGTGLVELGTLYGDWSGASAINRDGVVTGWSGWNIPARAFRAAPGQPMRDLGLLPYGSFGGVASASALNDGGDVVGGADSSSGWTPFLYTDAGGMVDLRYRITTAERLQYGIVAASAINNMGQIIAGYNNYNGTKYGTVLLTPVEREFGGPAAAPTVDVPVLVPPDNRMVMVSVDPHVTDEYDPSPICRISSVINPEGPATGPDLDVSIDYFLSVRLRASRLGTGTGRTYTIKLSCTDGLGVSSVSDVVVTVPHDGR